ncbi:ABC transporter permease subunit [Actinomadura rubrisoli]|uniref:ABC transporter permease n=1 Tax=Actinomadura rubrisoli TaxID=2530368 RepID=A0A4R5ACZ5_9ACTN|nr:ABC transporter permease subunit [Actinomadura rubrisoli]TDD70328.1 ABC transporter permease [Actinomadura rubrisoli]
MIWLAWRQFRSQAATAFAALTVLGIVLAATRPGLADDYDSGIAACTARGDCTPFTERFFEDHIPWFLSLGALLLLLPALIGLFWGAPLISRELEAGTHRLVWNQSITRTRWLAVKLGLVGLAAVTTTGLGSLLVTWWSDPIDRTARSFPRLGSVLFDVRGVVPIGYAALAFVLGVTVGMLVRRPLPAMALTLTVFAAVQIAMPLLVRPHLLPSKQVTTPITPSNLESLMFRGTEERAWVTVKLPDRGAWILSSTTLDASGNPVDSMRISPNTGPCAVSEGPGPSPACIAEMGRLGYRQQVTYQPSSRFWTFQWFETGIYLTAALGLTGLCFWWIRRRLS